MRVVWAAQLVVRAGREHDVAVEAARLHAHAALKGAGHEVVPFRVRVHAPAHMAHAVAAPVVEAVHVGFDDLRLEPATNVGDPALLDGVGDRFAHHQVLGQQDVARRHDDGAVNAVIVPAREHEARRPVVPAAGCVGAGIFRHGRIGVQLVGHIRAVGRGDAHDLGLFQDAGRDLDLLAQLGIGQHPRQQFGRLDGGQDAGAGGLDGELLGAEQQEDAVDQHVALPQRLDRLGHGGKAGLAHGPAIGRQGRGQAHVIHLCAQPLAGGHEGVGIVQPLGALRQHDQAFAVAHARHLQLMQADLGKARVVHVRLPVGDCYAWKSIVAARKPGRSSQGIMWPAPSTMRVSRCGTRD